MLTDVVIANKSYTRLSIPEDEDVDMIALRVIKQDCPDFLLPVKIMEIDGEQEVRYELLDGIRLSYSGMNMNKRDFNELLCNMLMPFKTCSDWFLDYHNLLLDNEHILIGRSGHTVKYLYIPTSEYTQSDAAIKEYFMDLILRAEIPDDQHYVMDLLRVLKNDNANLMTLLDFVMRNGAAGQGAEGHAMQEQNLHEPKAPIAPRGPGQTTGTAQGTVQNSAGSSRKENTPAPEPPKKSGSGTGARPGQTTGEFGKSDMQNALAGKLFGEEEEEDKNDSKGDKSKGGFLGRLKGKPKEAPGQDTKQGKAAGNPRPAPPAVSGNPAGGLMPPPPPFPGQGGQQAPTVSSGQGKGRQLPPPIVGHMNQGGQQAPAGLSGQGNQGGQQVPAGLSGQGNQGGQQFPAGSSSQVYSYEAEDVTDIPSDIDEADNNILRLRLIDNAGYNCPGMIEIDLRKGFATVGRLDKSGNAQSDFCFDASLSFISRRHFRVEKEGSQWVIIDLNSGNGTFVNEEALAPNIRHPLRSGDIVLLSRKQRLKYQVC